MSYQQALLEIEKMARMYKVFSETQNALTAIVSLDQANEEIKKQNKELSSEKEKLISDIKKKKEELKLIEKKNEEIVASFSKNMLLREQEKLSEIEAQVALREEAWKNKLEALQVAFNEKQKQSIALDTYLSAKRNEQASLETKIAETKKTIASMLG